MGWSQELPHANVVWQHSGEGRQIREETLFEHEGSFPWDIGTVKMVHYEIGMRILANKILLAVSIRNHNVFLVTTVAWN